LRRIRVGAGGGHGCWGRVENRFKQRDWEPETVKHPWAMEAKDGHREELCKQSPFILPQNTKFSSLYESGRYLAHRSGWPQSFAARK
jgi:hypothetical protein